MILPQLDIALWRVAALLRWRAAALARRANLRMLATATAAGPGLGWVWEKMP
ncbi:MAG: hypothetical protein LBR39_05580 [Coriobacteriales bacterium]|nr:hypothetical protein [Coriobacteriales bacterium]